MRVIGPEPDTDAPDAVHTIDMWFSPEKRRWVVQRLSGTGEAIGHPHICQTQDEADACLAEWLRRHPETHLTSPRPA